MRRFPTVVVRNEVMRSWLTLSDCKRSRLAQELGVSRGRVSQLLSSEQEPSAHLMAKLLLLTQLPYDRLFKIVRDEASLQQQRERFHEQSSSVMRKARGARV